MNKFLLAAFFSFILFSATAMACEFCYVKNINCPSNVAVGEDFSINFEFSGTGPDYPFEYLSLVRDGSVVVCKQLDKGSCIWNSYSFTTKAPTVAGTYTYSVKCYAGDSVDNGYCGMEDDSSSCVVNVGGAPLAVTSSDGCPSSCPSMCTSGQGCGCCQIQPDWSYACKVCNAGQVCQGTVCVSGCTNECSPSGKKECYGSSTYGGIRTCVKNSVTGCLVWSYATVCSNGCDSSTVTCKPACTSECNPSTTPTRCSGSMIVQKCVDTGGGCYKWQFKENCLGNYMCVNGACKLSCTDNCAVGGVRCASNGYEVQECKYVNGCNSWVWKKTCGTTEKCVNGVCTTSGCTDKCSPSGKKECRTTSSGTAYNVECKSINGCLDWIYSSNCASNQYCDATTKTCKTGSDPNLKCSDGTTNGACSSNKPKYCDNGNLINKCSLCGCPSNQECQTDGSCKKINGGETPVAGWKCKDGNTRAYQNANGDWSLAEHCPDGNGCNGNIKESNGRCVDGSCKYDTENCPNGCENGECKKFCTDPCDVGGIIESDTQCVGDVVVQICKYNSDNGCYEWKLEDFCGNNEKCVGGVCKLETCTDECDSAKCVGNALYECVMKDGCYNLMKKQTCSYYSKCDAEKGDCVSSVPMSCEDKSSCGECVTAMGKMGCLWCTGDGFCASVDKAVIMKCDGNWVQLLGDCPDGNAMMRTIESVSPTSPAVMNIDEEEKNIGGVNKVSLVPTKTVANVDIAIASSTLPKTVDVENNKVQGVFDVDTNLVDEEIESITIEFTVPKSEVKVLSNIYLCHVLDEENGEYERLPAICKLAGENYNCKATSTSASTFFIMTEEKEYCPYACCTNEENYTDKNCTTGYQCIDNKCIRIIIGGEETNQIETSDNTDYTVLILIGSGIVLIFLVLAAYMILRKSRDKKPSKNFDELYRKYGKKGTRRPVRRTRR